MNESDEGGALSAGARLVQEVLNPMKSTFVGKDEVIDLLGICLAGGENLFLLGPPGTAKSALVQELSRRLEGKTFDYLLTRFTEPNEVFGPFDIRKLREGDLVTNVEGMLPEADVVFLDEILNANSAILNSMLMVLNERVFRRGKETLPLRLLTVISASNHLPEDEALGALFDRFLLRVRCDNVPDERLEEVLDAGWRIDAGLVDRGTRLSVDDIRTLQGRLHEVDLSPMRERYAKLVLDLRHAGIDISDRRAVKLQRLIAASALLCGRTEATLSDCWILRYIWDRQEQQEVLASLVDEAIGKDEVEAARHPRAERQDAPDPEMLARDLQSIAERISPAEPDSAEQAALKEHLAVLSRRCQWLPDSEQRSYLQERIQALWGKWDEAP
jgi:MoxR-like ATPase